MLRTRVLLTLSLCMPALLCAVAGWTQAARISVEVPDALSYTQGNMVALQPMLELSGATMSKGANGIVTVTRQGKTFAFQPGKTAAKANGTAVALPMAPVAAGEVILVPVGALVQALGGTCTLDKAKKVVKVAMSGMAPLALPTQEMVTTDENGKSKPLAPKDFRDSSDQLYVMNADGSSIHRLTYGTANVTLPAFSKDGSKWAYMRNPSFMPLGDVFVRSADSPVSTCVRTSDMAKGSRVCISASLSPDGATAYFSEMPMTGDGLPSVCCCPFTGGTAKTIATGIFPAISPDGHTIAFVGADATKEHPQIMLMDADGTHQRLVKPGQANGMQFSADGSLLIFTMPYSEKDDAPQFIIICRPAAEAKEIKCIEAPADQRTDGESSPSIAPDSQRLVFLVKDKGIWSMKPDRSERKQISTQKATSVVCEPDGAHCLYTTDAGLFRMKLDGSEVTPLAKGIDVKSAEPSPDGKLIYFLVQPQALMDFG